MDIPKHYLKFAEALKSYNNSINIYSSSAYDKLGFHIQDSINLANLVGNKRQNIVDFGSGSGLPSVMLAIENTESNVFAIESKKKKRDFISRIKSDLNIHNLHVYEGDIDSFLKSFKNKKIHCITAKAFASLDKIELILKRNRAVVNEVFIPISKNQVDSMYNHLKEFVHCVEVEGVDFYYLHKR